MTKASSPRANTNPTKQPTMMRTNHPIPTAPSRFIATASLVAALSFTACQRRPGPEEVPGNPPAPAAKTATLETGRLGVAIDTLAKAPTEENLSRVNLAFAQLDSEITELEDRMLTADGTDRAVVSTKLGNLKNYRADEQAHLARIRVSPVTDATPAADSRSGAQKLEDTAAKVGDQIEESTQKVGDSIEHAAEKTGEAIKDATR
jgi:hypothetical protein